MVKLAAIENMNSIGSTKTQGSKSVTSQRYFFVTNILPTSTESFFF